MSSPVEKLNFERGVPVEGSWDKDFASDEAL